jgi:hypothetical protein
MLNVFAVVSSSGKRVHAGECSKKADHVYERGHFSCIDCSKDVLIRRGTLRAWHFAHYCAQDDRRCSHRNGGETLEHYNAKHFIAANIRSCAFVTCMCYGCGMQTLFKKRSIRIQGCNSEVEARIVNTSKIADVAITHPFTGRQIAAVEIFHTHAVDADKLQKCLEQGIDILEVTTREVERVQQKKTTGNDAVMTFRTTGMQYKLCLQCHLEQHAASSLLDQIRVWDWYEAMWEENCTYSVLKMHDSCSEQHATWQDSDYGRVYAYDQWYKSLWANACDSLVLKNLIQLRRVQLKKMLREGRDEAQICLDLEQSSNPSRKRGRQQQQQGCKGKCKACGEWMFQWGGDELCTIKSSCMACYAWDDLFCMDDEIYRKKYRKVDGRSGRESYNTLLVHGKCTMQCRSCERDCLLVHLVRYGLCFKCNMWYNDEVSVLERELLDLQAAVQLAC